MSRLGQSFRTVSHHILLSFCFASAAALVAVSAAPAMAQQAAPRVVQGRIVNKSDVVIKGATVYLKDGHTLAVRSYVAGNDGTYHFSQLDSNADYQLWAEVNGKKSSVKNITSFDTRKEFNITLKIDTK